ncbi:MFS transporter [Thermovenabulum sp.]|uniref:MFS transporter n=1 Tax=Thermovenabulum sp. TaxID=3100335 RepID=UPI003C7D2E66
MIKTEKVEEIGARYTEIKKNVYLIVSLAFIFTMFFNESGAIIIPYLVEKFKLSSVRAGLFSAVSMYVAAFASLPMGILVDYIGPKKTLTLSYALISTGSLLFVVFKDKYTGLLFGRAILALGFSATVPSVIKLIALWESKERFAYVNSSITAIGRSGAMLATTPLALMLLRFGWGSSFVILTILSIVITFCVFTYIIDNPYERINNIEEKAVKVSNPLNGINFLVRNNQFWLFILFSIINMSTYSVLFLSWGGVFLKQVLKIDTVTAANILLTGTFCTLLGAFAAGYLATKYGPKIINILAHSLTIVFLALLVLTLKNIPVFLLYIIYGGFSFTTSCVINCNTALSRILAGQKYIASAGGLNGLFTSVVGGGLMTQLWGYLINRGGGYNLNSFFLAINIQILLTIAGLAAIFFIKEEPIIKEGD